MVQTSEMTHEEKVCLYMTRNKRYLIEMLIECNRMLDVKKQEESIINQDKANDTTASYNFYKPTRREYIAAHILTGLLTNPDRYNTKSIVEDALAITDEIIKQLNEKNQ